MSSLVLYNLRVILLVIIACNPVQAFFKYEVQCVSSLKRRTSTCATGLWLSLCKCKCSKNRTRLSLGKFYGVFLQLIFG